MSAASSRLADDGSDEANVDRAAAMSGNKVVLVVEDEPLLALLADDIVKRAGFKSVFAWHADEALQILEARNEIGVVFTDVDMPGTMSGIELAATVHQRWQSIDVIVASGRTAAALGRLPNGVLFFGKPYPVDEIVSTLLNLRR
jgi:two-component system, response regulator PdtaR